MFKPRTPQDQATPAPQQADTHQDTQTPQKPTKPATRTARPHKPSFSEQRKALQAAYKPDFGPGDPRVKEILDNRDAELAKSATTLLKERFDVDPEPLAKPGKPGCGQPGKTGIGDGGLGSTRNPLRARARKAETQQMFLDRFRQCANMLLATEYAGISRTQVYNWLNDPVFNKAYDEAKQEAFDYREAVAWQRAEIGNARPIWMKDEDGKPTRVDLMREPSDRLMELFLKADRPERFRERTELTGANGSPLSLATQVVFQLPGTGREPKPVDVETVKQVADRP